MGIGTILLLLAVIVFLWAGYTNRANLWLAVGLALFAASFLIAQIVLK